MTTVLWQGGEFGRTAVAALFCKLKNVFEKWVFVCGFPLFFDRISD